MVTRSVLFFVCAVLSCACLVGALQYGYEEADLLSDSSLKSLFERWVSKHERTYADEMEVRFQIFKDNVLYIHSHNEVAEGYKLGLNEFADLTHEEFKMQRLGLRLDAENTLARRESGRKFSHENAEAPDSVDWREKGAVTKVKNQQQCGSCWAFSTTGSVEGINAIVTGDLISLSEQELVDCDKSKDQGCQGGLMDFAFEFIIKNGGIDTEEDYPYKAVNQRCDIDRENAHVVTIDDYVDVPHNNEDALRKAVSKQPVSVAIEADQRPFQFYQEGVFDGECGTQLDHGVLVVGYGTTDNGTDYWIVKNSWGPHWGDNGYIRLKRNLAEPEGMCGIAIQGSYPVKLGPNPPPGPPTPPSPPPAPEICDRTHQCETGTTCCCAVPMGKFCLAWGCCPMESATCCKDHRHCCPHDFPVCDLAEGLCTKDPRDVFGVPMLERTAAKFKIHWPLFGKKASKAPAEEAENVELSTRAVE